MDYKEIKEKILKVTTFENYNASPDLMELETERIKLLLELEKCQLLSSINHILVTKWHK